VTDDSPIWQEVRRFGDGKEGSHSLRGLSQYNFERAKTSE
jgi:hypothetical protein